MFFSQLCLTTFCSSARWPIMERTMSDARCRTFLIIWGQEPPCSHSGQIFPIGTPNLITFSLVLLNSCTNRSHFKHISQSGQAQDGINLWDLWKRLLRGLESSRATLQCSQSRLPWLRVRQLRQILRQRSSTTPPYGLIWLLGSGCFHVRRLPRYVSRWRRMQRPWGWRSFLL